MSHPIRVGKASIPPTAQSIDAQRKAQAWRAVREFRQMVPSLQSFAKSVAKRKVDIHLSGSTGAASDEGNIYISPPIALGRDLVHDKAKCHKRGPNRRQLCAACDAREEVIFYLFHEIGHIAGGSYVSTASFIDAEFAKLVDEWHPPAACNHGESLKRRIAVRSTYPLMANSFDFILGFILNVLEDARVDAAMFRARPGLKVVFESGLNRTSDPVWMAEQSFTPWSERPLNAQLMIGLFYVAAGHILATGNLSQEAQQVLEDGEIQSICERAAIARSPHQIMDLAMKAFRRFNELGHCVVPKCEVPPPVPPQPPSDEASDEEQDANHSTAQGSDESPPPKNDEADAGEGEGEGPGTPAQSEPDTSSDSEDESEGSDESGDRESDSGDTGEPSGDGAGDPGHQQGDSDTTSTELDNAEPGDTDEAEGGSGGGSDPKEGDHDAEAGGSGDAELPAENDEAGGDAEPGDAEPTGDSGLGGSDGGNAASQGTSDGADDPQDETESSPVGEGNGKGAAENGASADGNDAEPEDGNPEEGDEPQGGDTETARNPAVPGDDIWDEGYNATQEPEYVRNPGTREDVEQALRDLGLHMEPTGSDFGREHKTNPHFVSGEKPLADELSAEAMETVEQLEDQAVYLAVKQSDVFDTSATGVGGLEVFKYPYYAGSSGIRWPDTYQELITVEDVNIPERVVNKAVMRARIVFDANKRSKSTHDLKSGRVDPRVLGRRAALGDDRLFRQRTRPGRRDYFVAMGLDGSGSTSGYMRMQRIKRAALAQGELLHRIGVPFCMYVQSGGTSPRNFWGSYQTPSLWMLEVKNSREPWNTETQSRLLNYNHMAENYDGHNLEFLRKQCDKSTATDKIIIYYTDGAMPASNADEELEVLERELKICKAKGYVVLGVGINTDSPSQYGLDTVQVDSDDDLEKVIIQLGTRLTK